MRYNYTIAIDGSENQKGENEEEAIMLEFYSLVRKLNCKYKIIQLHIRREGEKTDHVRAVAYSDGF
jgi:hypothetical protein